jgi:hypothetical protein
MIEDRIAGYLYDVRQNPRQYLQDYGFAEDTERLEEFIDKNAIIEDAIDMDGIGHNISHYDGATFETRVEGVDYYAFRID